MIEGNKTFTMRSANNTNDDNRLRMFGKAKCKLCGGNVRFAIRHLKEKHPEVLEDRDEIRLNMSKITEKFFR